MKETQSRRRWPRWVLGTLLVLAAFAVVMVAIRARMRKELKARLEKQILARQGRELMAPVLFGEPRAGDALAEYELALGFGLSRPPDDLIPLCQLGAEPPTDEEWDRIRALIAAARPALEAFSRGVRCDRVRDPYEYRRGFNNQSFPDFMGWRAVAHHAVFEAFAKELDGDPRGAVRRLLEVMRSGQDLRRRGVLIDHMMGIAVEAIAIHGVRILLNRGLRAEPALSDLGWALDRLEAAEPSISDAYAGERIFALGMVVFPEARLQTGSGWDSFLFGLGWPAYERHLDRMVAATSRPFAEARPEHEAQARAIERSWNPFVKLFASDAGSAHQAEAEITLQRRVLRVRAAFLLYVVRNGHEPESLEAMTPGILAEVPADPFGRRGPLRYAPADAGSPARVWSVGEDGVDQGGALTDDRDGWRTAADAAFPLER